MPLPLPPTLENHYFLVIQKQVSKQACARSTEPLNTDAKAPVIYPSKAPKRGPQTRAGLREGQTQPTPWV